jgi:uncharacterized protein (TIGR02246 family)
MKIIHAFALITVAVSISSCQQPDTQQVEKATLDTASVKRSIDSLGGVVQKAHDLGDHKLLASTWAKDGILAIAGNPPVSGRDAIVTALSNLPPVPRGGRMGIHPIEIQVLSPEWAYVFGIDSLIYTPSGASEQVVETSTFFVLVRKTSEGWQSYRETLTPNQMRKETVN